MTRISNFDELVAQLSARQSVCRMAVVCGSDASTRSAVERAAEAGFVCPTFIDDNDVDAAAAAAVAMVRAGEADVIMKGLINTDNLLRAVLNKETGILPKGQVLTHITALEMPGMDRLLFCTDVAVLPQPTPEQRRCQIDYLLGLCRSMGIDEPRIGLVNCSEKVSEKHFPHTVDYRAIAAEAAEGRFGRCIIDGPLDLKTCFSAEALKKKGLTSPLEGRADAVVFPDIQAGNVFYKTVTLFCHARTAAVLAGPSVPVVLTSRGDNPDSKFYSIALACLNK